MALTKVSGEVIQNPLLVGTTTSTGTASQPLQVTGGAYISGNLGIGTTNPSSNLSISGNANVSGIVSASSFVGDGSGLIGVVGSGAGVIVKDGGTLVGTASTIDFGPNLSVSPISAGIVTVTAGVGVQSGGVSLGSGIEVLNFIGAGNTFQLNGNTLDISILSEGYWQKTSLGIHTLSNVGVGTTNPTVAVTIDNTSVLAAGIVTAYKFYGDGSGLTNLISPSTGIIIKDSGSPVGTAGTIDFGDGLSVSPVSAGIVTVNSSVQVYWQSTSAGINTLSNVGIGTTNPLSRLQVAGTARVTVLDAPTGYINSGVVTTLSGTNVSYTTGDFPTLRSATGIVTSLSGTNFNYSGVGTIGSAKVTTLSATTGYVNTGVTTILSGTNVTYSVGDFPSLRSNSGIVTTLTGVNVSYNVGDFPSLVSASGIVTALSGFNIAYSGISTFNNAKVTTLDATTGYVNVGVTTVLSGTNVTYGTGDFSSLRANSGIVTTLSGTNLSYSGVGTIGNAKVTTLSATTGYINTGVTTVLSGTNVHYTTGDFPSLRANSGIVTTLSGTNAAYTTGDFNNLRSASGIVTTLSGTDISYTGIATLNNAKVTTLDASTGYVNTGVTTVLSGTNIAYTTGDFANLRSASGIVTTLSGTNLSYSGVGTIGNAQVTTLDTTTGYINTGVATVLSGTNVAYTTGDFTNLRSATGIITALNGTNLSYSGISSFNNAKVTTLDSTTGYVNTGVTTVLSGTNVAYTTGDFSSLRANIGIVTALSGNNLSYSGISTFNNAQITTLDAQTGYINTGIITALSGTNFNYDGLGVINNAQITTLDAQIGYINTGIITTLSGTNISYSGINTFGNVQASTLNVSGISTFVGNINAASASFSGNVSIAGTLTYEDVTNIDSVGLVTARTGVRILDGGLSVVGASTFVGGGNFSGIVTASAFVGDGSGLTGIVVGSGGTWAVTSAGIHTTKNVGIGTTNPTSKLTVSGDVSVSGVVTASAFVGDGSGLTGITASGSGLNIQDNGSVVGTAGTIDFGDGLSVSPVSAGVVTVTSSTGSASQWTSTSSGIHTLSNVGIGTTNPTSQFTVYGDVKVTGIITASSFSGNVTSSIYAFSAGVSTTSETAGYATTAGISSAVSSTIDINTTGIITAARIVGIGSFQTLNVSGVSTLGNTIVGGATTQLIVNGDARVTGILTIGSSSITLNGSNNTINVGSGVTISGNSGNISAASFIGTSTNSDKLSGQDPCFYTNYQNFYNTPERNWTDVKQGGIGAGTTLVGISSTYVFSSPRTVSGVTTDRLTVTGHLYYPTSSNVGPEVDVVVLYHGTITDSGVTPLDAARTFLTIATNPSKINLRDKIVFSVAYPQDAIPGWTNPEAQFPEFADVLNMSTFYFGDNIYHAEAALLWAKETLSSRLASIGVGKTISRVYTFGHSQGAYLVHRLNTMHPVDGVVSNAPGPIDLLDRCSGIAQTTTVTCNKIGVGIGTTLSNPDAYLSRSLKSYTTGTLSPTLFTQALDDDAYQVNLMQNVFQPGINTCTEYGSIQFNYYATGGHDSFVNNTDVQRDIRNFVNSGYTGSYTFYNVGIGTTNPTSKLSVAGSVNVTGIVTAALFSGNGSSLTGIAGTWAVTSAGIHTTKNVGIGTTNPQTPLQVERYGVSTGFGTFTAAVGIATDLDTFTISATDYKTVEYTLHIQHSTGMQAQKVLVMQNGTTAYSQEYGVMYEPSIIVSVGSTISSGVCKLQVTPETGVTGLTTYRFVRQSLM